MDKCYTGKVVSHHEIVRDHFAMSVTSPARVCEALPGQFVMMRIKDREEPFLSRPLSICSTSIKGGEATVELLYRIQGRGTRMFSRLKEGDELTVMGPLGRGFDVPELARRLVLVAGGMGIVPLSFLAESVRKDNANRQMEVICYVGAQSPELLLGRDRLEAVCSKVLVSTEDGGEGYCGTVTELLERDMPLFGHEGDMMFCCGPRPMLKRIAELVEGSSISCQVSMEERMACGVGVCLGCAVRVKSEDTTHRYMRVCREGPVFDIREIDWS